MTKLITNKLKHHTISQLQESFTEKSNNTYYVLVSKHTSYSNGDLIIEQPSETDNELYVNPYQEGIFGKRINPSDVSFLSRRYNWTANTIYSMYDDKDKDLIDKQFYVTTSDNSNYFVYKVLNNNNNARSTQKPDNVDESACNFITTSDGYIWKYLYKMPKATFEKFATDEYMPVVKNANVAGNSVPGAIDAVKIEKAGSGYVSVLTGQFTAEDLRTNINVIVGDNTTYRLSNTASPNNAFYIGSCIYITSGAGYGQIRKIVNYLGGFTKVVTIESPFTVPPNETSQYLISPYVTVAGDGEGARGYAVISSNTTLNNYVSSVFMIDRGQNYTNGIALLTGNTGGTTNTAILRAIIPPKGNHGSDPENELFSRYFGISVNLANNENGFVTTENDYRSVHIIKDPLFNKVNLTLDDYHGAFSGNEKVYQVNAVKMFGNVTCNASCTIITGVSTDFQTSLVIGDKILIEDPSNEDRFLATVEAVSVNSSVQTLTTSSNAYFSTTSGRIYKVDLLCSGFRSGNSNPFVEISNAEPKFVVGKLVVGEQSGSWGIVTDINVNEKDFNNWNTFDNRFRIQYNTRNGPAANNDASAYQGAPPYANATLHSANSSYLFFTSVEGLFNTDTNDPIIITGTETSFEVGANKYYSDIQKGSGEVLYKENFYPVTRNDNQTETIKIVLRF
jgi:hypothetical protein